MEMAKGNGEMAAAEWQWNDGNQASLTLARSLLGRSTVLLAPGIRLAVQTSEAGFLLTPTRGRSKDVETSLLAVS